MTNLFYDAYRILFNVYSNGAYLKQAMADEQIEESKRATTTKLCYGVLDNDIYLHSRLSCLCDKRPKNAIRVILKLALYSIDFLKTPIYAVVDNAVDLTKKLGKTGASGFVNAILRKAENTEITYPTDKIKALSIKYSYPEFAVKMLIDAYGEKLAEEIMQGDEEKTCVRFNKGVDGEKYLTDNRWAYDKTPYENTFIVNGFKRNEDYDKGIYTFQSIGSVAICDMVGGGENLIDCCAAPGGKSVNLADKFEKVVSLDIHEHRVNLIFEYAKRMGKDNVFPKVWNSENVNSEYIDGFSAVLCDVPCSGFGVIKDNPDIKLHRDYNGILALTKTQYDILSACSSYVKKGGYLYYSTCSVFKEENQNVVNKFLENNKDFCEVEVKPLMPYLKGGVGVNFLPNVSFGAGFYFCALKRKV